MSPNSEVGYFSDGARRAAIAAALPLVATYFQDGGRLAGASRALSEANEGHEQSTADLLEALRLRVALAAATRLQTIAAEALVRPNFRYASHKEEVVGAIRGRLDMQKVIRETGRRTVPPRYPVITVNRSLATPENVLLACALLWLRHELRLPVTRQLMKRSAESLARDAAIFEIDRALAGPVLRDCRQVAGERLEHQRLDDLCDDVERRIAGGHAIAPAYAALLDWMRRCRAGQPAAEPGELEWSFYGAEFDTRLFEIWLLGQLRSRVLGAFEIDEGSWDFFSDTPAVDSLGANGVRVRLVHQTSIRKLRGDGMTLRWRRSARTPLGEIPDFLVALDHGDEARTLVLDAKLRRRPSTPTEEIYKLLGYFNNYGMNAEGRGAIFFYAQSPDVPASYEFRTDEDGWVVALSVDPERPDANPDGWDALIKMITASASEAVGASEP